MPKRSASKEGLEPHWLVRLYFKTGGVMHAASWTEPEVVELDGHNELEAKWINDTKYGDVIGWIEWEHVASSSWRYNN